MTGLAAAKTNSERSWITDLASLRRDAPFADLLWSAEDNERVVRAHKCIVYARATGSFQQRYIGVPYSISDADLSLYGHSSTSFRTFTPSSNSFGGSLTPTPHDPSGSPRPSSSTERSVSCDTLAAPPAALSLGSTDINVFEAAIEFFYTAAQEAKAFATVLDGFEDALELGEECEDGVFKLRQDLLYCWRSKLYADVSLVLEGSDSAPFAAHRALLASRSPYFRSLLLGNFGDSQQTVYTLPSPPFTPASTTFVLGYIYAGTLDFSSRKFDLSTAFEIWRCAAFFTMSVLQAEVEDKITSMINLSRAGRIFSFAHAVDVSNAQLAKTALPLVLDHFEEVWAGPPVGHLPYEVQKQLVRQVCAAVEPSTVVKVAKKVSALRKRIEPELAVWADHVRSMLDAVEEELVTILANRLPETIASSGFVDLIDGVGFSTDVLEWLLTLVVKGLTESKAAESYQGLVGSVLLREEGILADARVLVEDAKNGILKYIKRKWINVRAAGGFDELERWCLKELADELDVTPEELVAEGPRLRSSPARARNPPKRLVEGTPPTLRKRVVEGRPAVGQGTALASKTTPLVVRPRAVPSNQATSVQRAPATTTTRAGPPVGTQSSASRRPAASAEISRGRLTSSSLKVTAGEAPSASSAASISSLSSRRPPSVSGTRPRGRSASSSRPSSVPSSAPRTARRTTSPTPSTASRSSAVSKPPVRIRSAAGEGVEGSCSPRGAAPRNATPLTPSSSRPSRIASTVADSPRTRTLSSASSVASTQTQPRSLRRPASKASLASQRSSAPPTTAATTLRSAKPATKTPTKNPASPSPRSLRTSTPGRGRAPPLPAAAKTGPPGTTLLTGIPCIATVRGSRSMRIKAMVRYIGQLVGETGQWVGVEALESAIPAEAQNLALNDGSRDGVVYFKLTPSVSTTRSNRTDAPPSANAQLQAPDSSSSGAASLRPPSRKSRRSTSNDPAGGSGPRKGLFVRPDQILYVM